MASAAKAAHENAGVIAALKCVRENSSFAPFGAGSFPLSPRACVLGCILTPLRSYEAAVLLQRKSETRVFMRTLKPCTPARENRTGWGPRCCAT